MSCCVPVGHKESEDSFEEDAAELFFIKQHIQKGRI
jgi:hypothetical protein